MVEMPQLEKLYKKYKDQGLLVVSVNADEPSGIARAKAIVRQKRVTYPVVFDSASKVTGIYNPNTQFPYTVIIDKEGKIAHVKTGFSAGDEKILEEEIKKLLGQGAE
jgi:peroxiredoxin